MHSAPTAIIDYENELNPAQLAAVRFDQGPLLVIAGAGSGKTRTLTYRVARLVQDGVLPQEILLLTFTRKAASEMLHRAATLLDERCHQVPGGTFHAFGNGILRRYAQVLGYQNGFSIIDRADAESLAGAIRKEVLAGARQIQFPNKKTLINIISKAVNKATDIDEIVKAEYAHFMHGMDDIANIARQYEQRKREMTFMDYDDLLVNLKTLLAEHPDICRRLSARYRYIMVDEYQDTNKVQADIVYLLASAHQNIMVVGDDSQSIYAFRGANFKNIMSFPQIFPDTTIIRLEENYRSVQPILTLTNHLIGQASEKFTKTLFTQRSGGNLPVLAAAPDENAQSRYVIKKIKAALKNDVPLQDMAVLFRAGFHSFDLEIELAREGIEFIKVGGFKFMESAHIKDMLAYLKIVDAPGDRISWHRILQLLPGIGPKGAHNICTAVLAENNSYGGLQTARFAKSQSEPMVRLKQLYAGLDAQTMSVAQLGESVMQYYGPVLETTYDDHPRRRKDLEQLLAIMQRYDQLEPFLTDMALEPPNASNRGHGLTTDTSRDGAPDRLTLSTIHSAKGLEWHTVFILWALDGRFPSFQALDAPENYEEELRLMYVAATRARESLFFTYPKNVYDRASGGLLSQPSRFLDGFSKQLLSRITIRRRGARYGGWR